MTQPAVDVDLLVEHCNSIVRRGHIRAAELETKMEALLAPLFDEVADEAARLFTTYATRRTLVAATTPGVQSNSTMVCVTPTEAQRELLAVGDIDAEEMHCTLVYLGEFDGDLHTLAGALAQTAASHAPLTGKVAGVACFSDNGQGSPAIVLPDVPGLVELRVAVTQALVDAGFDYSRLHGYTPHITIDYTEALTTPPAELLHTPLDFAEIEIVRGNSERVALPLTGVKPLTAAVEANDPPDWSPPPADSLINLSVLVAKLRARMDPVRELTVETVIKSALETAPVLRGNSEPSLPPNQTVVAAGRRKPPPVGVSYDATNPIVSQMIKSSGGHITDIAESSRRKISQVIQKGYANGDSVSTVSSQIRDTIKSFSPARARLIARTELAGAVNGGSLAATQILDETMGGLGISKVWLTSPGAPNPRHETYPELDGQTVALFAQFDVGGTPLDYPGDPAGPPDEVCNCRCSISYTKSGEVIAQSSVDESIDPESIAEEAANGDGDGEIALAETVVRDDIPDSGVRVVAAEPGPDVGITAVSRDGFGNSETLRDQSSATRGTGHFGTGTYFASDVEHLGALVTEQSREIVGIDLRGLKLYKPRNENLGLQTHDALAQIDDLVASKEWVQDRSLMFRLERLAIDLPGGADAQSIFKAVTSARDDVAAGRLNVDSAATRVMKSLGYDGVDVRGLEGLDNTKYGSVVYRRVNPEAEGALPESGVVANEALTTVADLPRFEDAQILKAPTNARPFGHLKDTTLKVSISAWRKQANDLLAKSEKKTLTDVEAKKLSGLQDKLSGAIKEKQFRAGTPARPFSHLNDGQLQRMYERTREAAKQAPTRNVAQRKAQAELQAKAKGLQKEIKFRETRAAERVLLPKAEKGATQIVRARGRARAAARPSLGRDVQMTVARRKSGSGYELQGSYVKQGRRYKWVSARFATKGEAEAAQARHSLGYTTRTQQDFVLANLPADAATLGVKGRDMGFFDPARDSQKDAETTLRQLKMQGRVEKVDGRWQLTAPTVGSREPYTPPVEAQTARVQRLQDFYARRYKDYETRQGVFGVAPDAATPAADELKAAGADLQREVEVRLRKAGFDIDPSKPGKLSREYIAERRNMILQVLNEVREMGPGVGANLEGISAFSDESATGWLRNASRFFPRDWLAATGDARIDAARIDGTSGVTYYPDHGRFRIELDAAGRSGVYWEAQVGERVAAHELAHVFERTVDGLSRAEREQYVHRTEGERLVRRVNQPGALVRPDDFVVDYMGRDYVNVAPGSLRMPPPTARAFEFMSVGIESLMTGRYRMWESDPDMTQFILGVLVGI